MIMLRFFFTYILMPAKHVLRDYESLAAILSNLSLDIALNLLQLTPAKATNQWHK